MLKILRYVWLLLFFPIAALAANANSTPFQQGKDYKLVPVVAGAKSLSKNKVTVIEFFSFGCPACFHFEPSLEAWLEHKPDYVQFDRIPVIYEPGWDVLARGYYTAKNLGVAERLAPKFFAALQKQGQDLTNPATMEQFFINNGVSKSDFENTFNFSPGMDGQIVHGDNLMRLYKIFQVPTVVINGKYQVNPALTDGSAKRMIQIMDYLIEQERAKK
jgi:protein dithiol oxidoreductase (disulfide-forming)